MRCWLGVLILGLGVGPVAAKKAVPTPNLSIEGLPGTYSAVQRFTETAISNQGLGKTSTDDPWLGGLGQPVSGTLTLAANKTFSISMSYFDEGTWDILYDQEKKAEFLRFVGKKDSFDAVLAVRGLIMPGELGVWLQDNGAWYMVQFRKVAEPGTMPTDTYTASEVAVSSMFGQGDVKVDFAEVAKGSASGVRVGEGAFTKGARFGTPDTAKNSEEHSDARITMTFLPDGRFTVASTLSGEVQNGTYQANGSELRLTLDGAEAEMWEIGRDTISGKFAIRPAGSGASFLIEVPF